MTQERARVSEEFKLIPWWAIILALAILACFVTLLPVYGFRHPTGPRPPLPVRYLIAVVAGSVLAFAMLMVGYVNRDAKRRGMNVALWTLLCFLPNAIGFILYFLLRHPLQINCPQCGTTLRQNFNFCPQCKYNLHPACPQCQHALEPGDKYCPYCAHELASAT